MKMAKNKQSVREFLTTNHCIKLPIYQRNATAWGEMQCKKLVYDMVEAGKNGKKNNLLSIYYEKYDNEDIPITLLIDGQQRLTNTSLLMAAIAEYKQQNDVVLGASPEAILDNFLCFNGESRLKLKLEDNENFEKILNVVRSSYPSNLRNLPDCKLTDNFVYMKSLINDENINELWQGLKNTYIIPVELDDDDDAYTIFSTINLQYGTVLSLDELLFLNIWYNLGRDDIKTEQVCKDLWVPLIKRFGEEVYKNKPLFSYFVRYYVTFENDYPSPISFRKLYDETVQIFNDSENILETIIDFVDFGNLCADLFFAETDNENINEKLKILRYFGIDWVSLLIPIYQDYFNKRIDVHTFSEVLNLFEVYLVRVSTIKNTAVMKTLSRYIRHNRDYQNYLNSLLKVFKNPKFTGRLIDDEEFFNNLCSLNFYNKFKGDSIKYLWCKLNQDLNPKEIVRISDLSTTDHLNPQNPSKQTIDEWGDDFERYYYADNNKLGNLTCTNYNQKFGRVSYSEKRESYEESNFPLNRELAKNYPVLCHDQIVQRTEELAGRMVKIWSV